METNRHLRPPLIVATVLAAALLPTAAAAQPVTVSVGDFTCVEGNTSEQGPGTIRDCGLPLILSATPTATFNVQYAIGGGTATAGVDYTGGDRSLSGTLTFSPSWSPSSIGPVVIGDVEVEGDETVLVTLSNPTGGAVIGDGQGVLTILDDEGAPKPPLRSAWQIVRQGIPTINGSAYGNGTYVLVGAAGKVITSTDAVHWTTVQVPEAGELSTVIYGGGQFLATSSPQWVTQVHPARAFALTSPDGTHWTARQGGWGGLAAYGAGRHVLGGNDRVSVSTDGGVTWATHDVPSFQERQFSMSSIAYGAGTFVAVGQPPPSLGGGLPSLVYTSPDGVSWTRRADYPDGSLTSVAYVGSHFVAAADGGDGVIVSTDGIDWTRTSTRGGTTGGAQGVTAGGPGGDLAAVVTQGGVMISPDGLGGDVPGCPEGELCWPFYSYGERAAGENGDLATITWGHAGFVAAGRNGTIFVSSLDGRTWQSRTPAESRAFTDVVWTGSRYCAVGAAGISATSTDGTSWTYGSMLVTQGDESTWSQGARVVSAGEGVVAVKIGPEGGTSWILTSPDCLNWTDRSTTYPLIYYALRDLAHGDGVVVAVGNWSGPGGPPGPGIFRSADAGETWTQVGVGLPPEAWRGPWTVAYGSGRFVAAGRWGSPVLTSEDGGLTWISHPSPFHPDPEAIAYGHGVFVAAARWQIWTSADGAAWTRRSYCCNLFQNIAFGDGHFVMVGGGPMVGGDADLVASEEGATWIVNASPTRHSLLAVAYSPELRQWVALGDSVILQSDAYEPPTVWANDARVVEEQGGSQAVPVPLVLSHAWDQPVTVPWTTADGTATGGADYQAVPTPALVTFPPGTWMQGANATVFGDLAPEPDQAFTINLIAPTNATIGDGQATVTILNDEPTLTIDDGTVPEGDAGATEAVLTVTLGQAGADPVTVDYATANGSAIAPADYEAAAGTLTLTAAAPTQQIRVPVLGDTLGETNERFAVALFNASGAYVARSSGAVTITDDEPLPVLSINDPSGLEGEAGTRALVFSVLLSARTSATVTVAYATSDGTASAGSDYVSRSGTLNFSPGQTMQTFEITVNGDVEAETDETVHVALSGPVNATLEDDEGTGTILADEGRPEIPAEAVWTTSREGMGILSLASDGTAYVAVGNPYLGLGEIWTSTDTIAWTRRLDPDPRSRTLRAVAHGGGQFVAVGRVDDFAGGPTSPVILTSPDGTDWTVRDPGAGVTTPLFGVTYGNGLWVTVGSGGTILTSPDAVAWTRRTSGVTAGLREVAFGAGAFVAVGPNRTVLTSPDGVEWTPRHVPSDVPSLLLAVAFTGTQFVAVGGDPSGALPSGSAVLTSPDGLAWTRRAAPTSEALRDVAVGAGRILAVGFAVDGATPTVLASTDGVAWSARSLPLVSGASRSLVAATHGPRGFLVADLEGGLFSSNDGVAWRNRTLPASRRLLGVAHDGARYCAVGEAGAVARSPDGVTWANRSALDPAAYTRWTSIVHAGGLFWAAGVSGAIMSSPDCLTWTARHPATPLAPGDSTGILNDIASGNGVLVAVGSSYPVLGQNAAWILASTDGGATWTPRSPALPGGARHQLLDVAFGHGRFVVSGRDDDAQASFLNTSEDGALWTLRPAPWAGDAVSDVAFADGLFVAVGARTWTSADGLYWTLRQDELASNDSLYAVAGGDGRFVAVGSRGVVDASAGGFDWAVRPTDARRELYAVTHATGANRFVAVGASVTAYGDYAPLLRVGDVIVAEGQVPRAVNLAVSLSSASSQPVTVSYSTTDGTATAGSDYASSSGTLTFLPGQTARMVTVPILGDAVNEDDETFTLELTGPSGAVLVDGSGLATLLNDDPLPSVSVGGAATVEGSAGTTPLAFLVRLSGASSRAVTVTVATADGSAASPDDYLALGPTVLTFAPGETAQDVAVSVVGDTVREPNETFFIRLSSPVNAVLGTSLGTGRIRNDDR